MIDKRIRKGEDIGNDEERGFGIKKLRKGLKKVGGERLEKIGIGRERKGNIMKRREKRMWKIEVEDGDK